MNTANIHSAQRLGGRLAAAGDWMPRDLFCQMPGGFVLQWALEAGFAAERRSQEDREWLSRLADQFQAGYGDGTQGKPHDRSGWQAIDQQFAYMSGYEAGRGVAAHAR